MKTPSSLKVIQATASAGLALAGLQNANGAPLVQQAKSSDRTHDMGAVNQSSLKSIEQAFVKLPAVCKDRSVSFEPVAASHEVASASALAIHALV